MATKAKFSVNQIVASTGGKNVYRIIGKPHWTKFGYIYPIHGRDYQIGEISLRALTAREARGRKREGE